MLAQKPSRVPLGSPTTGRPAVPAIGRLGEGWLPGSAWMSLASTWRKRWVILYPPFPVWAGPD